MFQPICISVISFNLFPFFPFTLIDISIRFNFTNNVFPIKIRWNEKSPLSHFFPPPGINRLWNNNFICRIFFGFVLPVWFFFYLPSRRLHAQQQLQQQLQLQRWLSAPLSFSFSPRLRSIAPAGITHREAFKSDPSAAAQENTKGVWGGG